jgi:hypothetical protein
MIPTSPGRDPTSAGAGFSTDGIPEIAPTIRKVIADQGFGRTIDPDPFPGFTDERGRRRKLGA